MKEVCKFLANVIASMIASCIFVLYWLESRIAGRARVFPGWSQIMSLAPGICGVYLRRAFYRLVLPRCGRDSWIGFGTVFSHSTVEIGARAYVGVYCCIGDVSVGEDVLIGSHVSITNGSGQHGTERLDIPMREQPGSWPRVTVGRDTWIGDRAVVMCDVGNHCVIGAGSVVCKPIPDYAVAVGNPAKVIRCRRDDAAEFQKILG